MVASVHGDAGNGAYQPAMRERFRPLGIDAILRYAPFVLGCID
jgi:hypothetical protein